MPSNLDIPITDCQLINPSERIIPPYKPIHFGSMPTVKIDDHVVNSIIKDGFKLFYPQSHVGNIHLKVKRSCL